MRRFFKKLFTPPMIVIAALIMLWEDWLWDHLVRFMAWLGRLPVLRQLEAGIAKLPPYPAMGVFVLPSLLLLPVNLFAVYLTANGRAALGAGILIGAKLAGTAVLARLFSLCRPSLLTVNWFRRLYEAIGRFRQWLFNSPPWQAAVRWKNAVKVRLKRLTHRWRGGHFRRRWKAIVHLIRRRRARRATPPEQPAA
jgi:hypothetical protein